MDCHPNGHRHSPPFDSPHHVPPVGSQEILIGDAGVHLVMSRLLSWRIPVRDAMNGMPYDIIADVPGTGMLRIQVKTTTRVTHGKLRYRMQRGFHNSRRGVFDYEESDFDIAGFVDLSKSKLLFCVTPRRSIAFPAEWLDLPDVEHRSWLYALRHHDEVIRNRTARRSPATDMVPPIVPTPTPDPFRQPRASRSPVLPATFDVPRTPGAPPPSTPLTPPVPPASPFAGSDLSAGPRRTFFTSSEENAAQ